MQDSRNFTTNHQPMTLEERKRALGLKPTALDTGFEPDFGCSKYTESDYLPGKQEERRKLRAPAGADLSHLNSPHFRALQRIGSKGGKRSRK